MSLVLDANKVVYADFAAEPVVDINPKSLVILEQSNAVLNANAGGLPPLHYQWQKDWSIIPGATEDTFLIANAQAADAGAYSVIVSNLAGVVTSEVAIVTAVFPPGITLDPFSQNQPAGSGMTLLVLADGTEPLSYQWHKNLGEILDATNSTLVIDPLQTNDSGNYSVVVSNPYGIVTSQVASVFVSIPVNILLPPVSQVAPAFSTVEIAVVVEGYPDPT